MRIGVLVVMVIASSLLTRSAGADAGESAKHTIFVEYVGAGFGLGMINYDHRIKDWASVRGGAGFSASTGINSGEYINFALTGSWLHELGGAHHVDLSPGLGVLKEIGGDRSATIPSLLAGYRYQRSAGGFFGRVQLGIANFNRSDKEARTIPLFGLALGWTL